MKKILIFTILFAISFISFNFFKVKADERIESSCTLEIEDFELVNFQSIMVDVYKLNSSSDLIESYDLVAKIHFNDSQSCSFVHESSEKIYFKLDLSSLPIDYGVKEYYDIECTNFCIDKIDSVNLMDDLSIQVFNSNHEVLNCSYYLVEKGSNYLIYNIAGRNYTFQTVNNMNCEPQSINSIITNNEIQTDYDYYSVERNYSINLDEEYYNVDLVESFYFYYNDINNSNYISEYISNINSMIDNVISLFFSQGLYGLDNKVLNISISISENSINTDNHSTANGLNYSIFLELDYKLNNAANYALISHELSHLVIDNLIDNHYGDNSIRELLAAFFEIYALNFYSNRINLDIENTLDEWLLMRKDVINAAFLLSIKAMNYSTYYYFNGLFQFIYPESYNYMDYCCFLPIMFLYKYYNGEMFLYYIVEYSIDYSDNHFYDYVDNYGGGLINNSYEGYKAARANSYILYLFNNFQMKIENYYLYLCKIINFDSSFSTSVETVMFEYSILNNYFSLPIYSFFSTNGSLDNYVFYKDNCLAYKIGAINNITTIDLQFSQSVEVKIYNQDLQLISTFMSDRIKINNNYQSEISYIFISNTNSNDIYVSFNTSVINYLSLENLVISSNTTYNYVSDSDEVVSFYLESLNNNYDLRGHLQIYDLTIHNFVLPLNNNFYNNNMTVEFYNEILLFEVLSGHTYIIVLNLNNYFLNNVFDSCNLHFQNGNIDNLNHIKTYSIYEEMAGSLKVLHKFEYASYGQFHIICSISSLSNSVGVIIIKKSNGVFTYEYDEISSSSRSIDVFEDIIYGDTVYIALSNTSFSSNVIYETINEYDLNEVKTLIPDKFGAASVGTEVSVLGNQNESSLMTVGFSRCMYIDDVGLFAVRQSYYWYSSNESIAEVSIYGTVFAKASGYCNIYCVYKNDMSIIGIIQIRAVNDLQTDQVDLCFGFDVRNNGPRSGTQVTILQSPQLIVAHYNENIEINVGYTRLICLGNDSPSNIIQNFDWTSSDSNVASVSIYGTVMGLSPGYTTIQGVYKYDNRFKVTISIEVIQ